MWTRDIVKILRCPACRGELGFTGDRFICKACGATFPVRETIPDFRISTREDLLRGKNLQRLWGKTSDGKP